MFCVIIVSDVLVLIAYVLLNTIVSWGWNALGRLTRPRSFDEYVNRVETHEPRAIVG